MNRGARNSVAAQDWALKRKQQMERAARIKAERATLAPSQLEEDEGSGGGAGPSSVSPPGASPPEDGGHMLRSCSQPTSDMPLARLPARATTSDRPEWARDLAQQNRQTHAGGDSPQYDNPPPDSAFPAAPTGSGPAHWDWYQDPQQMQMPAAQQQYYMMQQQQQQQYMQYMQQQQYYQQQQQPGSQAMQFNPYPGQYPPAGYPPPGSHPVPPPISVNNDGAAATAARWSGTEVPLNQSDGGIGFNRMRQQPRVGLQDLQVGPSSPHRRASPPEGAAQVFGAPSPSPEPPVLLPPHSVSTPNAPRPTPHAPRPTPRAPCPTPHAPRPTPHTYAIPPMCPPHCRGPT